MLDSQLAEFIHDTMDLDAVHELVDRHKKLVFLNIYWHFHQAIWEHEDLEQVGHEALLKAATRWNPERGSFSSYASRYIYGSMMDYKYPNKVFRKCRTESGTSEKYS